MDGDNEGSSIMNESWMIIEGTPPAISDDGEVAVFETAAFSSGCLPTGVSDTTDKTKPEPFVEREKYHHVSLMVRTIGSL